MGGIFLAEAHVERASTGDAYPVAGFTEIMGQRRYKTEPPAGFLDTDVPRRPASTIVDVFQRITLCQTRPHQGQRQVLVEPAFFDVAERHHLDDCQIHATTVSPSKQIADFIPYAAFAL